MGILNRFFSKREKATYQKEPVEATDELLDLTAFWAIIERTKAKSFGDYEKQQKVLEEELFLLKAKEILCFHNQFQRLVSDIYHWDFWAAAYIMNEGCSDDCFMDFRAWLVAQGQEIYENAVKDVASLSTLEDINGGMWEGIAYVPFTVYKAKTDSDIPPNNLSYGDIEGEEWDEDDEDELQRRYPEIWAAFEG